MKDKFLDDIEATDYHYYSDISKSHILADSLIRERKWFEPVVGSVDIHEMDDVHLCNAMAWLSANRGSVYRWSDHLFNMQREYNKRIKLKQLKEQQSGV